MKFDDLVKKLGRYPNDEEYETCDEYKDHIKKAKEQNERWEKMKEKWAKKRSFQ